MSERQLPPGCAPSTTPMHSCDHMPDESSDDRRRRLARERQQRRRQTLRDAAAAGLQPITTDPPPHVAPNVQQETPDAHRRRLDRERHQRRRRRLRDAAAANMQPINTDPLPHATPHVQQETPDERRQCLARERPQRGPRILTPQQEFLAAERNLRLQECDCCHRRRLALKLNSHGICDVCHRDKQLPKKWSAANGMQPDAQVPAELSDLSFLEEMLIARYLPCIYVCRLRGGGQYGYRNHVIAFQQDLQTLVDELPRTPRAAHILVVRKQGLNNTHKDFRVRRARIVSALTWLQANNPLYANIQIRWDIVQQLPQDGVPTELEEIVDQDQDLPAQAQLDNSREVEQGDTVVTCLTDAVDPRQEAHKIRAAIDWPTRAQQPASEYSTAGLWTMSYPTLFPTGAADISNVGANGILRDVSLADWAQFLMCWKDGRFAKHPRWRYHVFNMLQRRRAHMTGRVFVNHADGQADMTLDELRDLLQSGDTATCNRLFHFGSQLRGTAAWKRARRAELLDMMDAKGLPHFFLTWSSADVQWNLLQCTLQQSEGMAPEQEVDDNGRNRRVNNNPALVTEWFVERLQIFMDTIAIKGMQVQDHWIIFEWQGRGSIHAHGVFWLKPGQCPFDNVQDVINDPARQNDQQVLLNFYDQFCCAWNPISWTPEQLQAMLMEEDKHPELANPPLPLPPHLEHPCRKQFNPDLAGDLAVLANFCNRHKNCSAQTCLKKRQGQWRCKAGVPWKLAVKSSFSDEGRSPGDAVYVPARNDPLMNSYPLKADAYQCWRANMDIKPVTSRHAMVQYLTKYCTKHEPPSQTLMEVTVKLQNRDNATSGDAYAKLLSASVGDRDYTAQEVAHHLLGLPAFKCSCTFQIASLTGTKEWNVEEGRLKHSLWEIYIARPAEQEMESFRTFTAKYNFYQGRYIKRRKEVIPRIFPRIYCASCTDPKFEEWCRLQMMVNIPCRSEDDLLCHHGSWRNALEHAAATASAPDRVVADFRSLTTHEDQEAAPADSASSSDDEDLPQHVQDDWMHAATIHTEFPHTQQDSGPPFLPWQFWEELRAQGFSHQMLQDARDFVRLQKANFTLPPVNYDNTDPALLNAGQRLAFHTLCNAVHNAMLDTTQHRTTRLIISGTAGTGKSYIIKCFVMHCHTLYGQEKATAAIRLAAPTGTAAFNIAGTTLHSLLALPVPLTSELPQMAPEALGNLQARLQGLKVLVVDEMSMVGRRFLGAIDTRLRQIFPDRHQEWFGGVSLVLLGDFGQLPPVCDLPMYSKAPGQGLSDAGKKVFAAFKQAIVLQKVERIAGNTPQLEHFTALLARLRNGEVTHADWKFLMQRSHHLLSPQEQASFNHAQVLVSTHQAEQDINEAQLHCLPAPKATLHAVNAGPRATSVKPDDAGGLNNVLRLARGARVMLRQNLWVDAGLTNGALGTVHGILYDPDGAQPPALPVAVLVQFDTYTGPSFLPHHPRTVPIPTHTCRWMKADKACSRTQIPLCLAFAITIHKSQGWTRQQVRLDIGPSEHSLGIAYVGCSRVTSPQGLCLHPADLRASEWARFQKINNARGHVERRAVDKALLRMHAKLERENHHK